MTQSASSLLSPTYQPSYPHYYALSALQTLQVNDRAGGHESSWLMITVHVEHALAILGHEPVVRADEVEGAVSHVVYCSADSGLGPEWVRGECETM
jgi:hypothetical protein